MLQCFVRLQFLWSHESEKVSKQEEDTSPEQLAWVLNGESVTVHLTAYLNECTMLLFPFQFIYCTLKTHNSWTIANWIHVCVTFWLSISSGIKSWSSDLNSWDTLLYYITILGTSAKLWAVWLCGKGCMHFLLLLWSSGKLKKYICLKYLWNLDVWPGGKLHLLAWKLTTVTTLGKIFPMGTKRKCDE
jgi:hypothetical protein